MRTTSDEEEDEEAGSGPNLQLLLDVARRRWRLIFACTALLTMAAAGISLTLPNRYEATTSVQIDQRKRNIVTFDSVVSDLKADNVTVDSEVEVIRSRALTLRVVEQLGLRNDAELAASFRPRDLLRKIGLVDSDETGPAVAPGERRPAAGLAAKRRGEDADTSAEPERDDVVRAFETRLKVGRLRNTLLIEIKYTSADPVKAARIVNALAETYLKAQLEAKAQAAGHANAVLEEKISALRDKLTESERKIERFKADNGMFDSDGQPLAERQMSREMEQLVQARNNTAQARARYEQARRMMLMGEGNEAVADVLQSVTVRVLRDELTKAMRREAELATKYGARHPEIQRVQADIAKAQAELSNEINKIIRNLKTEYEVAVDRERQLTISLELIKSESSVSKEKLWELKELQREAAANKQLFEAMLARAKQTYELVGLEVPDARIVERADVPPYPAGPKRKLIVALTAVLGMALSFGIAILLDLATPGILRAGDAERALGLRQLAAVPRLLRQGDGLVDPAGSVRLAVSDPFGVVASTIRRLRLEIERQRSGGAPRIVLVGSTLPGEGKTVVASNLAHHYAMAGARVLLIDGDMRQGRLSARLGMQGCPGLLDCLLQGTPAEQAIVHDPSCGLYLLPAMSGAGHVAPAAEVLAGPAFAMTLARLRSQFDLIIIDAPPILPVVDARIIADFADQIVLVLAWKSTPKTLVRRALGLLGANAGKIVGVVVNQVEPKHLGKALGDPALAAQMLGPRRRAA